MRSALVAMVTIAVFCCACTRGVIQPVNAGREYGDPVPLMVSHIGKGSPHYVLQNILCFDYMCRLKAGKKKAMRAISFEDFKKRLRKNAKRGEYNNLTPPRPRPAKKDTVVIRKDTVVIAPGAPIVPPAVQPAPVLATGDSLIVLSDLLFEVNSARLHDRHIATLDKLSKFLVEHPTLTVAIAGHTDNTGTEHHNVSLSTRRAEGVSDYLTSHGVTFDRITFEGFGSSQPIADNRSEEGRKRNRRVEVRLKEGNR